MSIAENLKEIQRIIADVESVSFEDLATECAALAVEVHADGEELDFESQPQIKMIEASREIDDAAEELKRVDFDEIIGALQEAETILEKLEETT